MMIVESLLKYPPGSPEFLEARCFELLSMVHAQPDGPCRPDKHCTECHVIGLVFGHPSWDHWATLAAGTEPD